MRQTFSRRSRRSEKARKGSADERVLRITVGPSEFTIEAGSPARSSAALKTMVRPSSSASRFWPKRV
jgi:hypothetical protein